MATVATAHDHKLADGTGFDGLDHFVGEGKTWLWPKPPTMLPCSMVRRGLAGEGHFDDFGKVLVSVGVGHDVLPTGIARGVGGVDAVFVGGVGEGGHDAVGGEENGAG